MQLHAAKGKQAGQKLLTNNEALNGKNKLNMEQTKPVLERKQSTLTAPTRDRSKTMMKRQAGKRPNAYDNLNRTVNKAKNPKLFPNMAGGSAQSEVNRDFSP